MAAVSNLSNNLEEEDEDEYIDMELNSYSREFEFQMSSVSMEKEEPTNNSPADELFYKGKLLPLHLPLRLQMVKELLQNSIKEPNKFEEGYTYSNTRELNFEECLFEYSNDDVVNGGNGENYTKKSWTKKLKFMKQSSIIGSKLKAYSRVYLKSLFGNSNIITKPTNETQILKEEQVFSKGTRHRRSYSLMAIKRHSSPSSSSSSSTTTNEYDQNLHVLKRSRSVNAEIESSSIEGAIAHCKQSQQSMIIRSQFLKN